jgi:hypothetical protein
MMKALAGSSEVVMSSILLLLPTSEPAADAVVEAPEACTARQETKAHRQQSSIVEQS